MENLKNGTKVRITSKSHCMPFETIVKVKDGKWDAWNEIEIEYLDESDWEYAQVDDFEVLPEEFSKKDLKTGMTIKTRNGQFSKVLLGTSQGDILGGTDEKVNQTWGCLSSYKEDLTYNCMLSKNSDIVKVYDAEYNNMAASLSVRGNLIWERNETPTLPEYVAINSEHGWHKDLQGMVFKVIEPLCSEAGSVMVLYKGDKRGLYLENYTVSSKAAFDAPCYVITTKSGGNPTEEKRCTKAYNKVGVVLKVVESYDGNKYGRLYFCEDGYAVRKSYCKPSTKEAFDAYRLSIKVPEYTMEEAIEKLGHEFKIKK